MQSDIHVLCMGSIAQLIPPSQADGPSSSEVKFANPKDYSELTFPRVVIVFSFNCKVSRDIDMFSSTPLSGLAFCKNVSHELITSWTCRRGSSSLTGSASAS